MSILRGVLAVSRRPPDHATATQLGNQLFGRDPLQREDPHHVSLRKQPCRKQAFNDRCVVSNRDAHNGCCCWFGVEPLRNSGGGHAYLFRDLSCRRTACDGTYPYDPVVVHGSLFSGGSHIMNIDQVYPWPRGNLLFAPWSGCEQMFARQAFSSGVPVMVLSGVIGNARGADG